MFGIFRSSANKEPKEPEEPKEAPHQEAPQQGSLAKMDVGSLVQQMQDTLSEINATVKGLSTEEQDARLDELDQKREQLLSDLRATFEKEKEELEAKHKAEVEDIAEKRRKEDEEREARRQKEDEELQEKASNEDREKEGKFEDDTSNVENDTDQQMEEIEEEARKVIESGKQKLQDLEEKRREINRQIDEQLKRPLPAIPTRRRARAATGASTKGSVKGHTPNASVPSTNEQASTPIKQDSSTVKENATSNVNGTSPDSSVKQEPSTEKGDEAVDADDSTPDTNTKQEPSTAKADDALDADDDTPDLDANQGSSTDKGDDALDVEDNTPDTDANQGTSTEKGDDTVDVEDNTPDTDANQGTSTEKGDDTVDADDNTADDNTADTNTEQVSPTEKGDDELDASDDTPEATKTLAEEATTHPAGEIGAQDDKGSQQDTSTQPSDSINGNAEAKDDNEGIPQDPSAQPSDGANGSAEPKGDSEQEDSKQEDSKPENSEQEITEREDSKQEDTEREDTKQDDSEQGDTKQDDSEQEDTKQDESEQDDSEQEDTKQDESEQDDSEQEDAEQTQSKKSSDSQKKPATKVTGDKSSAKAQDDPSGEKSTDEGSTDDEPATDDQGERAVGGGDDNIREKEDDEESREQGLSRSDLEGTPQEGKDRAHEEPDVEAPDVEEPDVEKERHETEPEQDNATKPTYEQPEHTNQEDKPAEDPTATAAPASDKDKSTSQPPTNIETDVDPSATTKLNDEKPSSSEEPRTPIEKQLPSSANEGPSQTPSAGHNQELQAAQQPSEALASESSGVTEAGQSQDEQGGDHLVPESDMTGDRAALDQPDPATTDVEGKQPASDDLITASDYQGTPLEQSSEKPSEQPSEQLSEQPSEQPAEQPAEQPTEEPTSTERGVDRTSQSSPPAEEPSLRTDAHASPTGMPPMKQSEATASHGSSGPDHSHTPKDADTGVASNEESSTDERREEQESTREHTPHATPSEQRQPGHPNEPDNQMDREQAAIPSSSKRQNRLMRGVSVTSAMLAHPPGHPVLPRGDSDILAPPSPLKGDLVFGFPSGSTLDPTPKPQTRPAQQAGDYFKFGDFLPAGQQALKETHSPLPVENETVHGEDDLFEIASTSTTPGVSQAGEEPNLGMYQPTDTDEVPPQAMAEDTPSHDAVGPKTPDATVRFRSWGSEVDEEEARSATPRGQVNEREDTSTQATPRPTAEPNADHSRVAEGDAEYKPQAHDDPGSTPKLSQAQKASLASGSSPVRLTFRKHRPRLTNVGWAPQPPSRDQPVTSPKHKHDGGKMLYSQALNKSGGNQSQAVPRTQANAVPQPNPNPEQGAASSGQGALQQVNMGRLRSNTIAPGSAASVGVKPQAGDHRRSSSNPGAWWRKDDAEDIDVQSAWFQGASKNRRCV
ncbi:Uu.00g070290.m01.CDS01 [Anthostomella pinea]|uniref:Uu.00g070290.m01.CDS01 n=1 Tax=Anthostomella pinea TaxID=933095 RepID=A0AAI8YNI8_9PEZI|nr:Uu.00g070290.m01.CDS01 [Anthostomella pinea]